MGDFFAEVQAMAAVVLQQAFVMLVLILVGAGCFKGGLLSGQTVSELSSLVLRVVNPIVILLAYQRPFAPELVANLGWSFLLSLAAYAIAIAVSYLCIPEKENRETAVERFSCIYSNCGFMGIPLVQAMFGYEGVFYLTAFLTVFNALVWSHGVMQISGERSLRSMVKVLYSPAILAIFLGMLLFFAHILLPEAAAEPLRIIGELNTPLAMFVAGATIAQTDLAKTVRKPRLLWLSFLTLLCIPCLCVLVFLPIPVDTTVKMTVLAAMAAPSAAICTMQCIRYGKNAAYSSEIFGVTTILSIGTMPLMMLVFEWAEKWIG